MCFDVVTLGKPRYSRHWLVTLRTYQYQAFFSAKYVDRADDKDADIAEVVSFIH